MIRVCCWPSCRRPSSVSNKQSHVASFVPKVSEMYSASMDERTMVGYFFEYELTSPSFSMKMKLNVNSRLSLLPAQSESEYLSMRSLSLPP